MLRCISFVLSALKLANDSNLSTLISSELECIWVIENFWPYFSDEIDVRSWIKCECMQIVRFFDFIRNSSTEISIAFPLRYFPDLGLSYHFTSAHLQRNTRNSGTFHRRCYICCWICGYVRFIFHDSRCIKLAKHAWIFEIKFMSHAVC